MMRNSAKGSMVLMIGQLVTAVISAATVIWLANVLGSTEYGQYTVAFIPVSIALLFQDLGMNMSIMRFCALYRNEERKDELKSVVMTGLVFSIITSMIISGLMYIFAGPIASVFLKHPEVESLVKAASLAVLGGGGLVTTIQAIFVGYEIMNLRSLIQVLWTVLRTVFSYILILSGFGVFGAVFANISSQIVAGLIGLLLLFVFIKFEPGSKGGLNFGMLKILLKYGLPLSMSTLLGGFLAQIYNYIMILFVSLDLIGNYSAAINFSVLVSFLMVPISTALFPLYSKFKKDDPQIKDIFQMSVKYTSMVTLPVVLMIIVLATPLSRIVYGSENYPYVPLFLSIYILTFGWEGLGGTSLGNLISGVGESGITLRATILTMVTGIILAVILVPTYGMNGLIVTTVLDARGGWIYQTIWLKRELKITVDWSSTIKIYFNGFGAFAITYLIIYLFQLSGWTALISGGLIFTLSYLIGLPLSGSLKEKDIKQLEFIANDLGPLGPFARLILSLMRHIVNNYIHVN
jgi:O-antigen/teichoic acid export membrane protein